MQIKEKWGRRRQGRGGGGVGREVGPDNGEKRRGGGEGRGGGGIGGAGQGEKTNDTHKQAFRRPEHDKRHKA